jgi:hypothetical protein
MTAKSTAYLIDRHTSPDRLTVYSALHGTRALPKAAAAWTLGEILDRVAAIAPDGGELVLLLTIRVMAALGLPLDKAPEGGHWVGLDTVRNWHHWQVTRLTPWTTFHRRIPGSSSSVVIHVGFGPWALDVGRCPFIQGTTPDCLARFDAWQARTGRAWHGTPGVAGISLLRANAAGVKGAAAGRRQTIPRWMLPDHIPGNVITAGLERDYTKDWQPGSLELGAHRHEYDTNMAYLAAAMVARVARDGLEHLPGLLADERRERKLAGYFLTDMDPWQDNRLPDPAGYRSALAKGLDPARTAATGKLVRWVTGPTLDLLDELQEAGLHGGYTILDAWAAPGVTTLRPWAELLRDVIGEARAVGDDATTAAGKAAYREAIGMLGRPGGLIYRPDWQSAVVAQCRANLWRKLRTIGMRTGYWPAAIDVDAVTYATDVSDPRELAASLGMALDAGKLGAWKHKGTQLLARVDELAGRRA